MWLQGSSNMLKNTWYDVVILKYSPLKGTSLKSDFTLPCSKSSRAGDKARDLTHLKPIFAIEKSPYKNKQNFRT